MSMRRWQWCRRLVRRDGAYAQRFFAQYRNRTLIAHNGLSVDWLKELLNLGGGGAHFRVDLRHTDPGARSPLDWILYRQILPLGLPLPLLLDVQTNRIDVRHMRRFGGICLPTDIPWILGDMRERQRVHASLRYIDGRFERTSSLALDDNGYYLDDDTVI